MNYMSLVEKWHKCSTQVKRSRGLWHCDGMYALWRRHCNWRGRYTRTFACERNNNNLRLIQVGDLLMWGNFQKKIHDKSSCSAVFSLSYHIYYRTLDSLPQATAIYDAWLKANLNIYSSKMGHFMTVSPWTKHFQSPSSHPQVPRTWNTEKSSTPPKELSNHVMFSSLP